LTPNLNVGHIIPVLDRLEDEVVSVVAAPSDTTGNGITVAAYNVVQNPEIYSKLASELKAAFPNPNSKLDFIVLERLPYLVTLPFTTDNLLGC
jgi:cytochrome P450